MSVASILSRLPGALALVILVAVPLAANPLSARVFDAERAILLRMLALPALCALIATFRALRRPNAIEIGALLYGAGSLLSCFVSAAPSQALAGDYTRQMGLLTDLALIALFFAMRRAREDDGAVETALRTATIGGGILGVLACIEALALDGRSSSIAGGPTFLGSHLSLLLPLALARVRGRVDALAAVAIGAGLIASGSRVAVLAGGCGALVIAIARGGEFAKRLAIGTGAIVASIALLALPPISSHLPQESLPVRIGELFSRHDGDVERRLYLWRDATRALGDDAAATLLGRGPDSIGVAFSSFVSEELQRRLGGKLRVDRLHGDPFDLLFTRGVTGLLGMALLVGGALLAARRRVGTDPLALGLLGLLAAATCDALLSVPGTTSRIFLFAAAGLLAGGGETPPARSESAGASERGLLAGAGAVALLFAVGFDGRSPAALGFFLLTTTSITGMSLIVTVVAAGALLRAVCVVAADPSPPSPVQVEASWLGFAALALPFALLATAALIATFPSSRRKASRPPMGPIEWALGTVAAIALGAAFLDDANRVRADVFARIATRVQHEAGRPQSAVSLLDRAATLAPEVARYSMRAAIAEVDALDSVPAHAAPSLEATFSAVSERVHECSRRAPRDGFLLAEGADALLRVAERMPSRRPILVAHALRLARPAREFAPTALPVLQANARLELALGNPDGALELLRKAIAIDNSPGLTHLLLGRAHAVRLDAQEAAFAYSIALPTGIGRLESLAGLALAAASIDGIEEAARLVIEMARTQRLPADLRAAIDGARPLLRLVAWDRLDAVFRGAERNFEGDPRTLEKVRRALDY